jgi:hypothetical protein
LRDEANAIVACAFRNGPIEDLHAGKASELLEDPELSRITDAEMRTIMLAVCQAVEKLPRLKQKGPDRYHLMLMQHNLRCCGRWDRAGADTSDAPSPHVAAGQAIEQLLSTPTARAWGVAPK